MWTEDVESRPRPIHILHLTDIHFLPESGKALYGIDTEKSFLAVLWHINNAGLTPDLVLLTGDVVHDPDPVGYARLGKYLKEFACPVYILPGNHDDIGEAGTLLADGHISFQPHITLPNTWQVLCLDSTAPGEPGGFLASCQLDLLETLLQKNPNRFTLIALHHHPIPCGSAWMDTMVLQNRETLFHCLSYHPHVKGIVFGHIHQAMDLYYAGQRLLGTPSTCFQFKPNQAIFALDPTAPPAYRWIVLYEDGRIETTLVAVTMAV